MHNDMSAKTERYHGLDLLRAFAMMLGLLIHANEAYQIPEIAKAMGMPSFINLPGWMDLMEVWIHLWRMPLFFVLAGFFGCMIVQRRGAAGFLQDRLLRVGLTLLVFVSIYDLLYPPPFFDFQLNHLWFLYYLMGVCAVASGFAWLMSRSGLAQTLARTLAWPGKTPWGLGLYLIPIIALTPFARPERWAIIPDAFGDFHLLPFLYYSLWFGIGATLYWHRQTLSALGHDYGQLVNGCAHHVRLRLLFFSFTECARSAPVQLGDLLQRCKQRRLVPVFHWPVPPSTQ